MGAREGRVLVHTCGRFNEHTLNPPVAGTICRALQRSAGFWVALDARQRDEVHPFPADDSRGTHVLCEAGFDCASRPAPGRRVVTKAKKPAKKKLRFYTWRQNNSGGSFIDPAFFVSVQAESLEAAKARAVGLGLYFDGAGDCPTIADEPACYSKPLREAAADSMDPSWLIAYADGSTERSEAGPRDGSRS